MPLKVEKRQTTSEVGQKKGAKRAHEKRGEDTENPADLIQTPQSWPVPKLALLGTTHVVFLPPLLFFFFIFYFFEKIDNNNNNNNNKIKRSEISASSMKTHVDDRGRAADQGLCVLTLFGIFLFQNPSPLRLRSTLFLLYLPFYPPNSIFYVYIYTRLCRLLPTCDQK